MDTANRIWTDNTISRITIHQDWIHNTNVRNPSADNVAYAHLYNNYMQNVTGYGNYSRGNTKMVIKAADVPNLVRTYAGPQSDIG